MGKSNATTINQSISNDIHSIELVVGYWELLVAVIGTPGNLLVLYLTLSFLRRGSQRSATSASGRRHQSNLWFIFSMTLSDLLFASVQAPMMFADYAFNVKYGAGECLLLYIVTHASTVCSSLSLLWLNLDKFLYLNQPLHYHGRMTWRRAVGAVIASWITSFAWALFYMLGPFTTYKPPCIFRPLRIDWYIAFAVGFFVMPTVVSLAVSIYIAFVVRRVKKENEARRRGASVTSTSASGGGHKSTANAKTIAFVFTTTIWSAVTYLPYRIAFLLYISPVFELIKGPYSIPILYFLLALLSTNAAGNPFITILTQRQYSLGFTALFKRQRFPAISYSTTEEGSCYESGTKRCGSSRGTTTAERTASTRRCTSRSSVRRSPESATVNGRAESRL